MGRFELDVTNRKNLLHKEPGVINQDLIIESLKKQLPKGSEAKYAKEAGIDPRKAECLIIEFQSISQIANISHMLKLRKLALSNNVINKIERLDELINLEELDLSFNSIKKIEGLSNLKNLKILNLHRNLITRIENLGYNLRLEVFVCSTNGIREFEAIHHLRRLVRLRALNLSGNPLCDQTDYRPYIVALLPEILILDYTRISSNEKTSADVIILQSKLAKIVAEEDGNRRRASVVEAKAELEHVYKTALADDIDGDVMWNSIRDGDEHGQLLQRIPGTEDMWKAFYETITQTSHELFVRAMRAFTIRENEYKAFNGAVKEIKDEVVLHARHMTEEFITYHQKSMLGIRPIVGQLEVREKLNGGKEFKGGLPPEYTQLQEHLTPLILAYVKKLHKIWYCLMTAEVELSEQITEVGLELEKSVRSVMDSWLTELSTHFNRFRTLSSQVKEALEQLLVPFSDIGGEDGESYRERWNEVRGEGMNIRRLLLPRFEVGGEYAEGQDVGPPISVLLQNISFMDTSPKNVKKMLKESHAHHISIINAREEELTGKLKAWLESAMVAIRTDEVDRHRHRISEISHFGDYHYAILQDEGMIERCLEVIPPLRASQPKELPKFLEEHGEYDLDAFEEHHYGFEA